MPCSSKDYPNRATDSARRPMREGDFDMYKALMEDVPGGPVGQLIDRLDHFYGSAVDSRA
jgi:hypothetical protein